MPAQARQRTRDGRCRLQVNHLILRALFTPAVAPTQPQRMIPLSPRQSRGKIAATAIGLIAFSRRERAPDLIRGGYQSQSQVGLPSRPSKSALADLCPSIPKLANKRAAE